MDINTEINIFIELLSDILFIVRKDIIGWPKSSFHLHSIS